MSNIVDIKLYRKLYPDLRFLPDDKLQAHYDSSGQKENRVPNQDVMDQYFAEHCPDFDVNFYMREYTDVPNNDLHARLHYMMHGAVENRSIKAVNLISSENNTTKQPSDTLLVTPEATNIGIIIHDQLGHDMTCIMDNMISNYRPCQIYYIYSDDSDLKKCITFSNENITYICKECTTFIIPENWYIQITSANTVINTPLPEIHDYININEPHDNFMLNGIIIYKNQGNYMIVP